jgi:hypothetical protein
MLLLNKALCNVVHIVGLIQRRHQVDLCACDTLSLDSTARPRLLVGGQIE